jgi:hypothetical protein
VPFPCGNVRDRTDKIRIATGQNSLYPPHLSTAHRRRVPLHSLFLLGLVRMDVPHNRSQVRMAHDRGQCERVSFEFRALPRSEGMPEIVQHEGNACFPTRAVVAVVQLG